MNNKQRAKSLPDITKLKQNSHKRKVKSDPVVHTYTDIFDKYPGLETGYEDFKKYAKYNL